MAAEEGSTKVSSGTQPSGQWSPVEDEWTILVPGRALIPARADAGDTRATELCPFCPGGIETPVGYEVLIVESRFPAVAPSARPVDEPAYGRHSVFLYTPDHRARLVDQTADRVAALLRRIAEHTSEMMTDTGIQAVFAFESVGDHFGPTVDHPHGQIIGFSFVPRRMLYGSPPCALCGYRGSDSSLVIERTNGVILQVAPAARFPFEMLMFPERHVGCLADLGEGELIGLSQLLATALRLARASNDRVMPQYLLTIMQAPRSHAATHHCRLELIPLHRPIGGLKRPGGVELGAGVFLNPLHPADAAEILRGFMA